MITGELVDALDLCSEFPKPVDDEVLRENLLDAVKRIFQSDTQVAVIVGEEGIGSTTLLAQFAKAHAKRAVCAFIRPWSKPAYSPEYLRATLSAQIAWILGDAELGSESLDESEYSKLLMRLAKNAAKKGPIYFVVDGISDIPDEDKFVRELILREILPIGLGNVFFLFAGNLLDIKTNLHRAVRATSYQMATFSFPEAEKFLQSLGQPEPVIREIYDLSRGFPARMAAVRRMVQGGAELTSILEQDLARLPDFLALEWAQIESCTETCRLLLALLAFGSEPSYVQDLAQIAGVTISSVRDEMNAIKIVALDETSGMVRFISESHKKFATKQLSKWRKQALDMIIDSLTKRQPSKDVVVLLPKFLERAGRTESLIQYLTPTHFESLLEETKSIASVTNQIELGFSTADKTSQQTSMLAFGIQKSVVASVQSLKPWLSEMRAYVELAEYSAALDMTSQALTREVRLQLLSFYARALSERGIAVDQTLKEEIKFLATDIDLKGLGDMAIDIACSLIVIDPELAINVVKEALGAQGSDEDIDSAFLILSIAAATTKPGHAGEVDAAVKANAQIRDASIQKLSEAVVAYFGERSAAEVIEKTKQLDEKSRFFFVKEWIATHRNRGDALEVVSYALDAMVADTAYLPSTKDLRVLATPLVYSADTTKLRELTSRVDAQKGLVKKLSASEDFVRLEMLLARAEARFDPRLALDRIRAIYKEIEGQKDLGTQVECLAWYVSSLSTLESVEAIRTSNLAPAARTELWEKLESLLGSTADHFTIAKAPLEALARFDIEDATTLAGRLNTSGRRDDAYGLIVRTARELPSRVNELGKIADVIDRIQNEHFRDQVILDALKSIANTPKGEIAETEAHVVLGLLERIADPAIRCRAASHGIRISGRQWPDKPDVTLAVVSRFQKASSVMPATWERLDAGYEVVAALTSNSKQLAKELVSQLRVFKEKESIRWVGSERLLKDCIHLATRAFSGLIPTRGYTLEDISRLDQTIKLLPSLSEQARCWADLVVRAWGRGDHDLVSRLVDTKVWPLIEAISQEDRVTFEAALTDVAPALACVGTTAALEKVAQLPVGARDWIHYRIARVLLTKIPFWEPIQQGKFEYRQISWSETLEIVNVIGRMTTDVILYMAIEDLVNALCQRRAKDWLNANQRADLAEKLKKIVDETLPDGNNIVHDGFVVGCMSQVYRLVPTSFGNWKSLKDRACAISNIADAVMAAAMVALAMPSKYQKERKEWLREIAQMADRIPAAVDRADRFYSMANMAQIEEPGISREFLKEAMVRSLAISASDDVSELQRRIFDLAHQLNPELAQALAKMLDDDPARRREKFAAEERIAVLELKKKLVGAQDIGENTRKLSRDCPEAAWLGLGSLNAGRAEPQKMENFGQYIRIARNLDFGKARKIYHWVLENAVRRLGQSEQSVAAVLRPIYTSLVETAGFAGRIMASVSSRPIVAVATAVYGGGDSQIFRGDDRDSAISVLRGWFASAVRTHLKICDPYFHPDDLEILRILGAECPACEVTILTGRGHLHGTSGRPIEEVFRERWRQLSDADPPDTDIVVACVEPGGDSPFHDRWWITEGAGLRIGTSVGSIGMGKISEISVLDPEEAGSREAEMDQFISRATRIHNGKRITYSVFTLTA